MLAHRDRRNRRRCATLVSSPPTAAFSPVTRRARALTGTRMRSAFTARQALGVERSRRPVLAEAERRRADLVVDRRRRERARRAPRAPSRRGPRRLGSDRARRQQPRIDREIAEPAVRRDRAGRRRRPPARSTSASSACPPCARRASCRSPTSSSRRGQPLDRALQIQAGMRRAAHVNVTVRRGRRSRFGELSAAERRQRACPATTVQLALAVDADGQRRLQRRPSSRRRRRPARRASHRRRACSRPAPRRASARSGSPPAMPGAAQRGGIGDQLRAPVGDMRRAVDADDVRLPGHRLGEHEAGRPSAGRCRYRDRAAAARWDRSASASAPGCAAA